MPDWSEPNVEHLTADVGSDEDVRRVISHIRATYGRLDVVVNNAGIAAMNERLAIKRLGTLEDVGRTVDFFSSQEADYITGCSASSRAPPNPLELRQSPGRRHRSRAPARPLCLPGPHS